METLIKLLPFAILKLTEFELIISNISFYTEILIDLTNQQTIIKSTLPGISRLKNLIRFIIELTNDTICNGAINTETNSFSVKI